MPYTAKTLADLQQSLADRHNGGVLPTSSVTLTYWTRLLNRGKDYCVRKLKINKPRSITTSSGTVAVGAYFLMVDKVWNDDNEEIKQIAERDSADADGLVYWISGNQQDGFYFNVPSGYDDTFTIHQAEQFPDMSLSTDICIIPDEEAVVAYAYAFLRKAETDPIGDAESALQECDTRLVELQSIKTNNDAVSEMTLEI